MLTSLYQPECWCFGPWCSVSTMLPPPVYHHTIILVYQPECWRFGPRGPYQPGYYLRVRKCGIVIDVEDKREDAHWHLFSRSEHKIISPSLAIQSTFRLKHPTTYPFSKPSPRELEPINYSGVHSSHEYLYLSSPIDTTSVTSLHPSPAHGHPREC